MVQLAVEGGSTNRSVVVKRPVSIPRSPMPYKPPTKPSSAYDKTKAITTYGKQQSPKTNPSSKSYYPPQRGATDAGPTVDNGRSAYLRNLKTDAKGRPIYDGSSTSRLAQNEWDKKYGGGGGGGGSAGGGGAAGGGKSGGYDMYTDPAYLASVAKLADLWKQANGYKGEIDTLMKNGFTYDPTTDASYKSLSELATKQAKVASGEAMETLNDRGILNSTVTSDRIGQIEQTAQDAVTAQIPNLKNAAYGMYMDKLSTLNNMWNSTVNQAQAERAFTEDKRRWELGYQLDKDKFNTGVNQWNQEFNYKKSQDAVQNTIEQQKLQLSSMASWQDAAGFKNTQQTNQALSELLTFTDPAKAYNYLATKSTSYVQNGVSLSDLLQALKDRFPGYDVSGKSGKPVFK